MSSLSCIVATLEKEEEEEEKLNYTRAAPVDLGSIGNPPIIRTKWKDDTTVGYKLVAKEWMIYSSVYRHVFYFCICICGGGGGHRIGQWQAIGHLQKCPLSLSLILSFFHS